MRDFMHFSAKRRRKRTILMILMRIQLLVLVVSSSKRSGANANKAVTSSPVYTLDSSRQTFAAAPTTAESSSPNLSRSFSTIVSVDIGTAAAWLAHSRPSTSIAALLTIGLE